jgi:hypothetical protein
VTISQRRRRHKVHLVTASRLIPIARPREHHIAVAVDDWITGSELQRLVIDFDPGQ